MSVPFITSSCIFCSHPITTFYHIAPSPRDFLFLFFVTFLYCGHIGKMENLATITREPSIMSNTGHSAWSIGFIYLRFLLSLLHLWWKNQILCQTHRMLKQLRLCIHASEKIYSSLCYVWFAYIWNSNFSLVYFVTIILQLLPEKYSYYRRVVREDNVSVDCVICMTTIDTVQRGSEYMVSDKIHFYLMIEYRFMWIIFSSLIYLTLSLIRR